MLLKSSTNILCFKQQLELFNPTHAALSNLQNNVNSLRLKTNVYRLKFSAACGNQPDR